jgi:hypothetical protein
MYKLDLLFFNVPIKEVCTPSQHYSPFQFLFLPVHTLMRANIITKLLWWGGGGTSSQENLQSH